MNDSMKKYAVALPVGALLCNSAIAKLTVVDENFQAQTVNAAPRNLAGTVGTWIPNQYVNGRDPYFDPNYVTPDQNWQANVIAMDNNKVGFLNNTVRGPYPNPQWFDLDGFLKFTRPATTGVVVHASFDFYHSNGIPAIGFTNDIQSMADATATHSGPNYSLASGGDIADDEGVLTGAGGGAAANVIPQIASVLVLNPGYNSRFFETLNSSNTAIALNPDTNGLAGSLQTMELQYTVGNSTYDFVKLNGVEVRVQGSNALVPITHPGGLVDGIFFSDTGKKGTQYSYDNVHVDITTPIPEWITDGSADWNTDSNWSGVLPNAVGAEARFLGAITTNRTIYTNSAVTVGKMLFNNVNTYSLTGGGSLTLQVVTGAASIAVQAGRQQINLPLTFASNAVINVSPGATLAIDDPVTIKSGKTVTKTGNLVSSARWTLETNAALINSADSLTIFGAPIIGSGAKVDLTTNSLVVDYRGIPDPIATILSQLQSGYASGAWTGSGVVTSSAIPGRSTLGYRDNTASQSILVKFAQFGDANLDGFVTSSDFVAMASNFNQSGQIWISGDFNLDGLVNAMDFNALAISYGQPLLGAQAFGSVVPEPASVLAGLMIGLMLRRRAARGSRR